MKGGYGNQQLFRQSTRPSASHADFVALLANIMATVEAALAMPATEHRVAGDAPTQPHRTHPVTKGTNRATPLVPEAKRIAATGLADAGQITVEQRNVRTTNADIRHIDDDFAALRSWARDILNAADTGTCDQKSSHEVGSSDRGAEGALDDGRCHTRAPSTRWGVLLDGESLLIAIAYNRLLPGDETRRDATLVRKGLANCVAIDAIRVEREREVLPP